MGTIVYCRCAFAAVVPQEVTDGVRRGLLEAGVKFETVPDLCELAARKDPALLRWAGDGPLTIAACHPRAVKALLLAAGAEVPPDGDRLRVVNMRELTAGAALQQLLPGQAGAPSLDPGTTEISGEAAADAGSPPWQPWFPVIDFERCTNCLQCLSFCLFDVYDVDAGQRIQVRHPEHCKTNCPACSRVCPEVAIMFPKYAAGPINGAPVSQGDAARETMKVDISSLLGGDLYASLRQRSASARTRFSAERSAEQALHERRKCLAQWQAGADLLEGVDLGSLPGPDEIRRRAEQAAARADAARKALGGG